MVHKKKMAAKKRQPRAKGSTAPNKVMDAAWMKKRILALLEESQKLAKERQKAIDFANSANAKLQSLNGASGEVQNQFLELFPREWKLFLPKLQAAAKAGAKPDSPDDD